MSGHVPIHPDLHHGLRAVPLIYNVLWASSGLELWGFFFFFFKARQVTWQERFWRGLGLLPRRLSLLHWKESHFPPWLSLVSITVSEKRQSGAKSVVETVLFNSPFSVLSIRVITCGSGSSDCCNTILL